MISICRLYDLMSGTNEYVEYVEPIYTKLNGMYGYLSVSSFNVYFIWPDEQHVCFDNVSDRFRVEYVSVKVDTSDSDFLLKTIADRIRNNVEIIEYADGRSPEKNIDECMKIIKNDLSTYHIRKK